MSEELPNSIVVLHVEDDDATAYLFRISLLELNPTARLHRAKNVGQALSFLNREGSDASAPPDVVVLDLDLIGSTGFEVLRVIRCHPDLQKIPVLIFSSSNDSSDRSLARNLGVNGYLLKQSDLSSFTSAAETVLRTVAKPREARGGLG